MPSLILHHFSWAGNPKGQQSGRGFYPGLVSLRASGIIQSVRTCIASSSNKERQAHSVCIVLSRSHALSLYLSFSSLQAKSNRSKINLPRKEKKNQAYFHKIFLFCFLDQKHRTSQIKLSESQMWIRFK